MAKENKSRGGFGLFLAGLGIGSLVGVLYAPKSGDLTRDELASEAKYKAESLRQRSREATRSAGEYVERSKGQVNSAVSRSKSQVGQYVESGKHQVNDYVARGKNAVEAGRQKFNETYNDGRQEAADQKAKVQASYEAGKQAYQEASAAPVTKEEFIAKPESTS